METVLLFSYNAFISKVKCIVEELTTKYNIGVISHTSSKLQEIKDLFPESESQKIHALSRSKTSNFIKQWLARDVYFIIIGTSDQDMYLASNNKIPLINPLWEHTTDGIKKYGMPINSIKKLQKYLTIYESSTTWFEKIEVDNKSTVFSLMSAKTMPSVSRYRTNELELVNGFHDLLKNGDNSKPYIDILYYYLSAIIAKQKDLRQITDWAIFPSSGLTLNSEMLKLKERLRYLMNGKKNFPLLIRNTVVTKSHAMDYTARLHCDRHFNSINLSPDYQGKLNGRVVCLLDDYLTNGTSFETARNLLLHENVSHIYFIALGSFEKTYIKQDYELSGDLYTPNYRYKNNSTSYLTPEINSSAVDVITLLSKLF